MVNNIEPNVLLECTATVVSSFISHNHVPAADLPDLIKNVYGGFKSLDWSGAVGFTALRTPQEVSELIEQSIHEDYIVCLEDGKKMKMLKRYLRTNYNMTPEEYRKKWGLPPDYPMVAPRYAERRSQLAKDIGLGHRSHRRARKAVPAFAAGRVDLLENA